MKSGVEFTKEPLNTAVLEKACYVVFFIKKVINFQLIKTIRYFEHLKKVYDA